MGATDGMTELYDAIRTRLLTYTDGGAAPNTIAAAIGTRLYNESPPDPPAGAKMTVPFVLLTIDGNPADREKDPGRIALNVEVQVINSPRTTIAATRRIAKLAWEALGTYQVGNATDGFIKLHVPPFPSTLPRGGGDADRDVVQIRIVTDGFAYWKALSTVLT